MGLYNSQLHRSINAYGSCYCHRSTKRVNHPADCSTPICVFISVYWLTIPHPLDWLHSPLCHRQSDPIRTGIQGFTYDIRTAILPFMFIFNTQLLLIGIDTWWHLLLTVLSSIVAMLIFSAATQGWWFTKNKWWETLLLLLLTLLSSVLVIGGIKYTHPKNSILVQTSNKLLKVCRLTRYRTHGGRRKY